MDGVELRHLRSFVVLADELHFTRAAARMQLAQPALSQHIKNLERVLGARLFERGGRAVRLTEAGALFLPHASATLRHIEQAITAVREEVDGVTGHLRVGVFGSGIGEWTAPVLAAFRAARPAVHVSVVELTLLQQVTELVSHNVDVALVRPPIDDDRVRVVTLALEPRVAVVPVTHPMADAPYAVVDDIIDDPVVMPHPEQPRWWTDYWNLMDRRPGHPPSEIGPQGARTFVELLHALVIRNCVTTMPASMARYSHAAGLSFLPLADVGPCEVAVAVPSEDESLNAALFVSVAQSIVAGGSAYRDATSRAVVAPLPVHRARAGDPLLGRERIAIGR